MGLQRVHSAGSLFFLSEERPRSFYFFQKSDTKKFPYAFAQKSSPRHTGMGLRLPSAGHSPSFIRPRPAVFADLEERESVFELKNDFEESDLPFRVDVFIWDEVPSRFHKNIERNHVVLQNSSKTDF